MIKFFFIFLTIMLLNSCSFDTKSGFWTASKKIEQEKKLFKENELFKNEIALEKELNPLIRIKLSPKSINRTFFNNQNNSGRVNYNGNLKNISKFKFSKIKNFEFFEPEVIFYKNDLIFFDNKGSILRFNDQSKIVWKNNYYSKLEKNLNPFLFLANNKNILVVADNISKFYAINIDNGELLWSNTSSAPFASEVKIYKDKFFVIDSQNILRCFSLKNGSQLWEIKTEKRLLKSQKKLSLIVSNNKVFFNNSIGDISAVDIQSGNLIWLTPTQNIENLNYSYLLKSSDLISSQNSILFSNNNNQFFSLDLNNGVLNWEQKVNSDLRPILIDDLIFTISLEGFLVILDNDTGSLIRVTDIFNQFSLKKRKKIKPIGFVVGLENIYLTTNHGRLLIIDIQTGKTKSILKIDSNKISRPFALNQNLFIIKDNSILKLD